MLILKTVDSNMKAYNGFTWPSTGEPVVAEDWNPAAVCGGGLHGLPWGEGDGSLLDWSADAKWLVFEANTGDVICFDAKCKARCGTVVHVGDQVSATFFIATHGGENKIIVGGTVTAGNDGTATAGYGGTATAGDGGTATAGDGGTATAGDDGTATAGDGGTATAGDGGTATAGDGGTATAGDRGTATAGNDGTATAGDGGTATAGDRGTATADNGGTATAGVGGIATAGYGGIATAGDRGTATAGNGGTATAGYGGTATAGARGTIIIRWRVGMANRIAVGHIGEKGIAAHTAYVVEAGILVPAAGATAA